MTSPTHSSTVGPVVDVATPASRKLNLLGAFWILIALFPLAIINYVIIDALAQADAIVSSRRPVIWAGLLLMPVMGWFALGSAVQRFSAAKKQRFFRVGSGGISVCVPDDRLGPTFTFSLKMLQFDLPWEQIKTWYPYVQSMNGIPTERSIVFKTLKNEEIKIKTYHFAEPQKKIAADIMGARSVMQLGEDPAPAESFSLPQGVGDQSVQFAKKRDQIKEFDLRAVPSPQRAVCLERIAGLVEARIARVCPTESGYKVSRKKYQPFKEWANVLGLRLYVRRGLLDGYEIQVEPNDSEYRKLTISMAPSNLISDVRRYLSISIGVAVFLVSLNWMGEIRLWLGEYSRLTPIALFAIGLAAAGVSTAFLQLPISLIKLIASDKQRDAAQQLGIKSGIQEVHI